MNKSEVSSLQSPSRKRELLEEGRFHGRRFRRYSDGTLKAVTSSGWKKFSSHNEFYDYHWKNHYEKKSQSSGSSMMWLKNLFNPPPTGTKRGK